jgi:protein gp37
MGLPKYARGFELVVHEDQLRLPYTWNAGRMVFVNSMSDLFHEEVPVEFIRRVFDVMNDNPQHVFQVLTKRSRRLLEVHRELRWSHNIWMGVSVEDVRVLERVDHLRVTDARVKFLSCEPLIGPLPGLDLRHIDWVIVGGESGYRPRPMDPEWVLGIQERCEDARVPFFFKQWGGRSKKKNGRILNGRTYDEMPALAADLV